ncbi:MAG: CheR family methyltransferase [Bacteroidales bacterium]
MGDKDCIYFLRRHLPELGYRWEGFRKVRKQVCKRINRRIRELDLENIHAYREYLESHGEEMNVLDGMCNITISRFYRDKGVFDSISSMVFPALIEQTREDRQGQTREDRQGQTREDWQGQTREDRQGQAREDRQEQIRCWSAGSASGEEPYTLTIIWNLAVPAEHKRGLSLQITVTDRDPHLIERAENGIYPGGALKELPWEWKERAFEKNDNDFRIRKEFRRDVRFLKQDIRSGLPEGTFDLVLCRNLAFTYFREELQREILQRIMTRLTPGGYLITGSHESLPEQREDLMRVEKCIYRRGIT